jgi:hypothetical protein
VAKVTARATVRCLRLQRQMALETGLDDGRGEDEGGVAGLAAA